MHQLHSDNRLPPPMTFDEVSMERSKSFLNALSELKNLRPQLYSAAEYCENSYLHSEQKQMGHANLLCIVPILSDVPEGTFPVYCGIITSCTAVVLISSETVLDNLKDYAVRALVNAVDHLGTVAYKLTDVFEQQTSDLSSMELKVSCLNQQLLTCKTYMDIEGLRQQELLTSTPKHHKHYVLPNSVTKKVHFSPQIRTDGRQILFQATPRLRPAGIPASTTLSWHLASESKPTLSGTQHAFIGTEESKAPRATFGGFRLLDAEGNLPSKSSSSDHLQSPSGGPAANVAPQSFSVTMKESLGSSKPLTGFRSLEHPGRGKIIRAPVRSRSLFSAFMAKQKVIKPSCMS